MQSHSKLSRKGRNENLLQQQHGALLTCKEGNSKMKKMSVHVTGMQKMTGSVALDTD